MARLSFDRFIDLLAVVTVIQEMSYSVELYFDDANQAKLHSLRIQCAQLAGLPPRDDDARPHVSLVVADTLNLPASRALVASFARENAAFAISLASVGFFPSSEQVAFLAPKVSSDLLSLHEKFVAQFGAVASGIWQHYSSAQWVPHCTLTTGFPTHRVPSLLELCASFGLPISCTVAEIGIVQFPPAKQLFRAKLGG